MCGTEPVFAGSEGILSRTMDLLPFSHLLGVSLLLHGAPVFPKWASQQAAAIRRRYSEEISGASALFSVVHAPLGSISVCGIDLMGTRELTVSSRQPTRIVEVLLGSNTNEITGSGEPTGSPER